MTASVEIQEKTLFLLAEREISQFDTRKFVDWASDLLVSNIESENIIILAGLDFAESEEIEKYFWKSVVDLKLDLTKDKHEILHDYSLQICKLVIDEKLDPILAVSKMVNIYWAFEPSFEEKFSLFLFLEEDIQFLHSDPKEYPYQALIFQDLSLQNLHSYLIKEFEFFLEQEELNIQKDIWDKYYCQNCSSIVGKTERTFYQLKKPFRHTKSVCDNCSSDRLLSFFSHKGRRSMLDHLKKK